MPIAPVTKVVELYGLATHGKADWRAVVAAQRCPFLGLNWKMTAKTILVQLHHKTSTFDHLSKHLVLAMQDHLLAYMRREFAFGGIKGVRDGDPMHFHAYELRKGVGAYTLRLVERVSTDADGIAACLGLQAVSKVELILKQIEDKLPGSILLTVGRSLPVPTTVTATEDDQAS